MKLIKVEHAYKIYKNGTTAIADLSVTIDKGEFVFVIGSTGSGKSTFIKMLYREEKPTRGKVIVGGIDVAKLRNSKVYKLRRKLGVVFQDFKLLPKLNVYENVSFALETLGLPNNEIRPKVLKAIEAVGLKEKTRNLPSELSGGEQQRVAIARALANDPKLLICDEPTGNLDKETEDEILNIFKELAHKENKCVIIVTHSKNVCDNADVVYELKKNKIEKHELGKSRKPSLSYFFI